MINSDNFKYAVTDIYSPFGWFDDIKLNSPLSIMMFNRTTECWIINVIILYIASILMFFFHHHFYNWVIIFDASQLFWASIGFLLLSIKEDISYYECNILTKFIIFPVVCSFVFIAHVVYFFIKNKYSNDDSPKTIKKFERKLKIKRLLNV